MTIAINWDGLTTVSLTGTGIVDKFIAIQKLHWEDLLERKLISQELFSSKMSELLISSMSEGVKAWLGKTKLEYELSYIQSQIDLNEKEQSIKDHQLNCLLPAQCALVNSQVFEVQANTSTKQYEVNTLLPAQKLKIDADVESIQAKIDEINKDINIKDYNLTQMLPSQKAKIDWESNLLDFQGLLAGSQRDKIIEENKGLKATFHNTGIKLVADVTKNLGYGNSSLNTTDYKVTLGTPTGDGKVDAEIDLLNKKGLAADKSASASQTAASQGLTIATTQAEATKEAARIRANGMVAAVEAGQT